VTVSILLADDHVILRQGLRALLDAQPDLKVVGEAGDGIEAVRLAGELRPQVMVLDIMMPGLNGLEVTRQSNKLCKIVILSMYANEAYVAEALENGASGFVLKEATATDLIQAIRAVLRGEKYLSKPFTEEAIQTYREREKSGIGNAFDVLTNRERQVLQLVVEGATSVMIAEKLRISTRTVEQHRSHILHKLNLHSQTELVRFALQHELNSQ
jgi:two-component system response regulator NreC